MLFLIYNNISFLLCRLKRLWIMIQTTQMKKFPQWRGDHCLVADQGREPLPSTTEKQVNSFPISSFQLQIKTQFLLFSKMLLQCLKMLFSWIRILYIVPCCCFCVCLDLSFKTPIRSIMRHEHILSEISPATPRNSTARNIYTPIVRFLTPSKESE